MLGIPSNILPIFAIGVVAILFGVRSLVYYDKVRSPLFKYFGWSTVFFGLSSLFLAIPYVLDPSSFVIKSLVTISNVLYIIAIFIMFRIIWYLGYRKSTPYSYMFVPVFVLSGISLALDLANRANANYYLADNIAYYSASTISTYILALLSLSIVVVGVLTIRQAYEITNKVERLRIIVIGMMFLLAGLIVEYNFLLNRVENYTVNILVAFMISIILVGILIFFMKITPIKSRDEK